MNGDEGARLENMVAVSLLKHVYAKVDYQAEEYVLHYIRTKDGQEVDFALIKDGDIEQIIEVKQADQSVSKSLYTFHQKYHFPAVQLVQQLRYDRMVDTIKVMKAEQFLSELLM